MLRPRRCYHRFACGAYPREPELPNPSPCKVLHLRNLAQDVAEDDLVELVRPFGRVSGIVLLRTWNQAFVQMQDIAKAFLVIRHFASRQATVRGRDVSIQFSARKELYPAEETCSAILLVTMLDSVCHVTVDALHQTFKSFGPIEKIAIFPQSTVLAQALIQYASPRDAREAKHRLHKSKILNGSCTMEIQYSRTDEVRVACNNDLSRYYVPVFFSPSHVYLVVLFWQRLHKQFFAKCKVSVHSRRRKRSPDETRCPMSNNEPALRAAPLESKHADDKRAQAVQPLLGLRKCPANQRLLCETRARTGTDERRLPSGPCDGLPQGSFTVWKENGDHSIRSLMLAAPSHAFLQLGDWEPVPVRVCQEVLPPDQGDPRLQPGAGHPRGGRGEALRGAWCDRQGGGVAGEGGEEAEGSSGGIHQRRECDRGHRLQAVELLERRQGAPCLLEVPCFQPRILTSGI
ncbi:polypyrimidine tract-binding protein homolog 2 isoform X2 [Selaginella moellendorffii]|uniref:polypyrimidine tract-binding protein homolog 2 isoform X2 n=1 Tax=Selaginella moellendorffii TaxID=88036 RepID=UPI000D1C4365|nr:polypyrimidine tract-binding protein homolog 2 isoform X2 [Selaginella moellendorffii]|eukprot:XP_024521601.1 polypyrimidine tract-binding protein homolog 2 isoform X2 [Selaginella moellendorffii]